MIDPATPEASPSMTTAAKRLCSSCSVGMARFREGALPPAIGFRRVGQQDWERRQVAVPFDQRGGVWKAADRAFEQVPHGGSDRTAVIVDQNADAVGIVDAVASQMQLLDGFHRQGFDPGSRIAAEVPAGHVDVVDVEQQTTTRVEDEFTEELRSR